MGGGQWHPHFSHSITDELCASTPPTSTPLLLLHQVRSCVCIVHLSTRRYIFHPKGEMEKRTPRTIFRGGTSETSMMIKLRKILRVFRAIYQVCANICVFWHSFAMCWGAPFLVEIYVDEAYFELTLSRFWPLE